MTSLAAFSAWSICQRSWRCSSSGCIAQSPLLGFSFAVFAKPPLWDIMSVGWTKRRHHCMDWLPYWMLGTGHGALWFGWAELLCTLQS